MRKRFLVLSLVLISVLMACTFVACSGGTGGRCSGGHTWADHTTLVEATCTTPGSVLQQCSVCGIKREASVSALGHKLELEPGSAIDPTCTTDGYTGTQACVNNGCSYSVQGSVIPAIQHAYGVWVSLGDGTHKRVCGNDNSHVEIESCSGGTADCGTKAKCDICGGEYGEVSTEHVFDKQVVDEKYLASPATCTSKATYYFSCKCGTKGTETFESGDILPHVYDQKNTDTKYLKHAANCMSAAEYYLSCACGHLDKATAGTFFDGVPTGKHVFDREVAEEKYLVTPATCTSKAQYHLSCECGEEGTTTFEYGNLLAHSMTHHQAVPATCVATGFVEYWTCSSCGFNYDTAQGGTVLGSVVEQINPNNHVNTSVTVSEIAPTCTAEGRTANLYCDDCDKEVIASTVVDALGHTGGTATCTDKAVCDRCDQPYGDLAGHAFGNWTSNGNDTHSRVCANDASHTETAPCSGGTATPTSKAICDDCGKEYGSFAEIPTGQVTVVTKIGDYAKANGWEDGTGYQTVNLDAIVFATAIPTTGQYNNTGRYYSSNSSWRVYQNENPQLTIKASEGFVIVSVKITYSYSKTGVLTLDGVNKTSNEVVNVNANSVVFSVGNTKSDVTNGNIQITAIEVVYKYACAHSNTEEREQVNATCTKDGYTAGTFCKDCESYVSGGEVIEALGHDYPTTWTSDGNGKHYKECGVCGEKDEKDCEYTLETVLANNANLCAHATCTSRATFYKVCECGHFNSDDQNVFESGSALGHIDEDGNNVCDREECKLPLCNGNHVASDYVVDGEYHYQVCTACHEEINRDKHSATSLNQGNDTQHWYVCDICDAEYGHENHQEEAGECACGKLIESKVINTIAGALVAEEGAEVNLNGVVSGLYQGGWNGQYTSFYITDGNDRILIYRAPEPVYVGDTVNVVGVISVYDNTNQVAQNSDVTITKAHDCSFSEADCINASKCTICGKLNAEALGHDDANNDGKCDRCDANLNAPEPELAGTITFDDTSKRTEFSTSIQVWKENGITVTNKKANSTSNVGNFAQPARFYKSSSLSIEYTAMTKIVFMCDTGSYATALSNSITPGKYTVSVVDKNVIVIFAEAADSFVIDSLSAQVRMDGIEVYTTPAGGNSPEAQHTFGEWHDEIPATCVATGTKGHKQCTTCQNYFDAEGVEITDLTIAVDPNAHDLEHVDAQASTCTEQGWDAYEYCKREGCNHTTKELLPLAEHTPSAAVVENRVESTCTTQGTYDSVVYCSECNAEISRTTVKLDLDEDAHSWVAGAVTAPTCTEDGYTTYTCECGDTYKDFDENSALGHAFTTYTGTEATCLEDGVKTSKCDRCDAVDTKVTPALGHTDSNSDKICDTCQEALCNGNHTPAEAVKENVVDATCSNEGSYYSVVYCSVCHVQISKEQKTIDKLPHTEETIPAVDANCTKTGLTAGKKCSVCGEITKAQEEVPAKGHNEVDIPAVDASCTETGLTAGKKCSVCGEITKAQEEVPAKGHNEVDIPAVDATCTETGLKAGKECSVCGEITQAQEEVPAKGHTGGEATCTEKAICDVCQEPYGDLAPHTPNKNVCECGYEYSVDEIIGLAEGLTTDGEYLEGTYCLTGVVTEAQAFNTKYNSVTVTILVEGTEKEYSFLCYGMKGDGADKIGVDDTITVSGKIKNYKGTIEFDTNCVLESYTIAQYEVKFETLGGGTISGIPTGTVARGTEFTIKVTPDEANNYVIDAVTVNGVAVPGTDGNYTITVNAESTVIAYFKKAGAGSTVTTNTVTTNISEYATANSWANETKYTSITMDDNITASVTGGSNTGKYYTNGTNWRIYQTETPTLTISGGANVTILSVKITYNISNSGTLTYNGNIASGTVVDVNASTITFGVGNTGDKTNGQVRVTAIEVNYQVEKAAEGACTHPEEKWGAWTVAKEATCTEMGVEMATCECGEIKTRYSLPINPNNHVYDKEVATGDYLVSGATCKDLAVYNKSCACGAKGTATFTHGDYAQHTFGEWHDEIPATCVATGTKGHKQCTTCQNYFDAEGVEITDLTIAVDPNAHDLEHVGAQASTCTVPGWNAYEYCKREGCNHNTKVELELAEHTPLAAVEENRVESTCKVNGSYDSVVYCSVCNAELSRETVELELAEHTPSAAVEENRNESTCTVKGSYDSVVYCSVCNAELSKETVELELAEHDWSDWVVDVAATCTATGTSHRDCQREGCNKTESRTDVMISHVDSDHNNVCDSCLGSLCEEHTPGHMESDEDGHWYVCSECGFALEKVEHTFGEWQTTTEASCTVDGEKRRDCVSCDAFETDVIKAEGHKHTAQVTEPTCTDDGYTTYTCACGDKYTVVVENSALGHEYDSVVTAPTCTENGYTTHTCSVCGDVVVDSHVDKTGHSLNNVYVVEDNTLYTIDVCTVEGCDHTENKQEFEQEVAPVATESDLRTVLENGFNAKLTADVELTGGSIEIIGKTVTVDLNGKTITANGTKGNACEAFYVREGAALTINGDGTVLAKNNGALHVEALSAVDGAVVEINGGNFIAEGSTAVYATRGAIVTINGGSFKSDPYYGVYYTLDINEADTLGQIIVKGGTYYNFDPANHTNDGSANTNYLAEGYHSMADGDNYVVSAHSHSANVTAPTCTENGYTTYTCACGDTYTANETSATGHTAGEVVVENNVEETCTADGSYDNVTYCTVCEEELSRQTVTVDALGHAEVAHEAKEPTCTEIGWDAYVTCSRCDHTTYQEKASLGHDMQTVDAQASTCTVPGWNAYEQCSRCAHNTKVELGLDENAHAWVEGTTVAPTCTEGGYTNYTCSHNAEHTKQDDVTPATGHTDGEAVEENRIESTCTTPGTYDSVVYCSVCGEELSRTKKELALDANAHTWSEWTTTTHATCIAEGEKRRECEYCDAFETEELPIDEDAHDWNSGVQTKAPTCIAEGVMTFTCQHNSDHVDTRAIDKIAHDYDLNGYCANCPAVNKEMPVGTFTMGSDDASKKGSESTSSKSSYTEESGEFILTISNASYFYPGTYDALGQAVIKLGSSSKAGKFSFNVPEGVDQVRIYLAGRGDKDGNVTFSGNNFAINGTSSKSVVLNKHSGDGEYNCIVLDISGATTITVETSKPTNGDIRAMLNAVEFIKVVECEHTDRVAGAGVEPTCTEKGYTHFVCPDCKEEFNWDYVDALDHDMQPVAAKDAACEEDGHSAYEQCSRCEHHTEFEVTPATGHSPEDAVQENVVNATCTEAGSYDSVVYCATCNEELSREEETIDPLGHVDNDEPKDNKCDRCTETMCKEHVNALGEFEHDENEHWQVCDNCGERFNDGTHSWDLNGTEDPECTAEGKNTYVCSCGASKQEPISALGHAYETSVTAPTCTEQGYTTHTCSRCDDSYTDTYVAATGHTATEYVQTETEHYQVCTVCESEFNRAEHATTGTCVCGKVNATWHVAESLNVGDKVMLVCESASKQLNGISTTSTKYGIGAAYSSTPAEVYTLEVVAGSNSGTFAFKTADGKYLSWSSGNSLTVSDAVSTNSSWTVAFDGTNAVIKNAKDNTRILQWNASSPRFACYTSVQTAIQLYVYA